MIRTEKINAFINSLNESEFCYVRHVMGIAAGLVEFINTYNITKDEFCKAVGISPRKYKAFIDGGYNYDLRDISKIEAFKYQKMLEKKKQEAEEQSKIVKFPDYEYSFTKLQPKQISTGFGFEEAVNKEDVAKAVKNAIGHVEFDVIWNHIVITLQRIKIPFDQWGAVASEIELLTGIKFKIR